MAWQLTDAGYTVELDVWDWAVGRNFMALTLGRGVFAIGALLCSADSGASAQPCASR